MTDTTFNLRDYQVSRWRKLAEQRLEHITELFVTGRWQRYFSERDFLEMVRQTKDAVAIWRRLDGPPVEARREFAKAPAIHLEEPAAADAAPDASPVGYLAPYVKLDAFLDEFEPVWVTEVAELRPAMRLPSPFEDDLGLVALQRVGRT